MVEWQLHKPKPSLTTLQKLHSHFSAFSFITDVISKSLHLRMLLFQTVQGEKQEKPTDQDFATANKLLGQTWRCLKYIFPFHKTAFSNTLWLSSSWQLCSLAVRCSLGKIGFKKMAPLLLIPPQEYQISWLAKSLANKISTLNFILFFKSCNGLIRNLKSKATNFGDVKGPILLPSP